MTSLHPTGPFLTHLETGVVLALYAVDQLYDFELQRAPDVAGAPGTFETIAAEMAGGTELYIDRLPKDGAARWYRLRHTGLGDTPSDWLGPVSGTPDVLPASPQRPLLSTMQLDDFSWTDSADGTSRTYTWTCGPRVSAVLIFNDLVTGGGGGLPKPTSTTFPAAVLPASTATYTTLKPPQGSQRFLRFEPRTAAAGVSGDVHIAVLDAAPSALNGRIEAAVTGGTADLTLTVDAGASNWPVTVQLFENNESSPAIYQTVLSAPATIDKTTTGASALGGRPLPLRELRRWTLVLTDVAGLVVRIPGSADRDALPAGAVTQNDYRAAPQLTAAYDDDTDAVRVTVPGGKTKTYAGLSGSGAVTYTVGDLLDDTTTESAFANDSSRTPYLVEFHGGGAYRTFWGPAPLHGALPTGPSLDVTATPGSSSYSVVYTAAGGTVLLSINGGAYSTAPASPITVTRPVAGGTPLEYTFKIAPVGGQAVVNIVTIQPIDKDTITADLVVTPSAPTDTTQTFVATATNPGGGAPPLLFYTLAGCTAGGGTIPAGTYSYTSSTPVVVDRPPFGTTTQASIEFRAGVIGGGAERIQRTILNQVKTNFGPSLTVTETPGPTTYSIVWGGVGTITLSIDGGAYTTPPSSPISVSRNSTDHTYSFKALRDGQELTRSVAIPALPSSVAAGNGFFVSVSQALYSTAANQVQFSWNWSGSSAYFQVYVRETLSAGGTTGWFHPGDTAAGATTYIHTSVQDLNGGFSPYVTIEYYLRAMTPSGPAITESERNSAPYGIP